LLTWTLRVSACSRRQAWRRNDGCNSAKGCVIGRTAAGCDGATQRVQLVSLLDKRALDAVVDSVIDRLCLRRKLFDHRSWPSQAARKHLIWNMHAHASCHERYIFS
jgi:hypothetical protein